MRFPFGFRWLTGTSAVAVTSLVLGAVAGLAAALTISAPFKSDGGYSTDVPEINSVARVVWLRGTRAPTGDVLIGPVSYHVKRAPVAPITHGRVIAASVTCVEGWRGLENGPVGRRVLMTCPGRTQGATGAASDRVGPKAEHQRVPATVHDSLIRGYAVPLDLPQVLPARNL